MGISLRSVQRMWQAHQLQPHRLRTSNARGIPSLAAKLTGIVGLFVEPPAHTVGALFARYNGHASPACEIFSLLLETVGASTMAYGSGIRGLARAHEVVYSLSVAHGGGWLYHGENPGW
jgi:hypothetical protein